MLHVLKLPRKRFNSIFKSGRGGAVFTQIVQILVKSIAVLGVFICVSGSGCNPPTPVVAEKLFVVSLKSAVQRRNYMEKQIGKFGFPDDKVAFVDAVDGRKDFAPQFDPPGSACWGPPDPGKASTRFNLSKYSGKPTEAYETTFNGWKWKGTALSDLINSGAMAKDTTISPTEYALIESNKKVWQEIVDNNISWAIVVEDDAKFKIETWQELFNLGDFNEDAEYIQLFINGNSCWWTGNGSPVILPGGTVGYAISKKGAEKALRAFAPAYYPLDLQLFEHFAYYFHSYYNSVYIEKYLTEFPLINAYCKSPEIISESNYGKESTIDH